VLEDSPTGVAAGRAAGALTIGVPSLPGVVLDADVVAGSLADDAVWRALGLVASVP
jgi:sugar-phosphatase